MPDVQPLPKAKKASKRRKPRPSTNKGVARLLWGKLVRDRGVCEYGETFGVAHKCEGRHEAAHIIRARYSGTFTDLDNGRCLCVKHHTLIDQNNAELMRFVGEEEYQRLYEKAAAWTAARPSPALFWRGERERLTELAKARGLL